MKIPLTIVMFIICSQTHVFSQEKPSSIKFIDEKYETQKESGNSYFVDLLILALQKTDNEFGLAHLQPISSPM